MTLFKHILLSAGLSLSAETTALAQALYHEARGEGYHGQIAVGLVIKNRVLSDRWPNSIHEVIHQPYQFSYVHEMDDKTMHNEDARETAYRAAQAVLYSDQWPSMGNVAFYHTDAVKPLWDYSKLQKEVVVGSHVFYSCVVSSC